MSEWSFIFILNLQGKELSLSVRCDFSIDPQQSQRMWLSLPQNNEEYYAVLIWVYDDRFMCVKGYVGTNETYLACVIILVKQFYRVG